MAWNYKAEQTALNGSWPDQQHAKALVLIEGYKIAKHRWTEVVK